MLDGQWDNTPWQGDEHDQHPYGMGEGGVEVAYRTCVGQVLVDVLGLDVGTTGDVARGHYPMDVALGPLTTTFSLS